MKDIGGYSLEAFADYIRSESQKVFPMLTTISTSQIRARNRPQSGDNLAMRLLRDQGSSRVSRLTYERSPAEVLCEAGSRKLPSFCAPSFTDRPITDPCSYLDFGPLLGSLPQSSKIILIHGETSTFWR